MVASALANSPPIACRVSGVACAHAIVAVEKQAECVMPQIEVEDESLNCLTDDELRELPRVADKCVMRFYDVIA